jgi:hypothetical protein
LITDVSAVTARIMVVVKFALGGGFGNEIAGYSRQALLRSALGQFSHFG